MKFLAVTNYVFSFIVLALWAVKGGDFPSDAFTLCTLAGAIFHAAWGIQQEIKNRP